ncbi:unnamed protein product [Brugia pahangi]|uniref:7TM_GPCR_Srx domain-containing protein n=1 Tax=Brugia pahangi TaxID=6280 RepID=A0A0N4T548_BRUPA|nr:unnamed protein product [Brugia pahangi]
MINRFELSSPGGYLFFGNGQMAFPRVNALSFRFTFVALLMVYQSFFIGGSRGLHTVGIVTTRNIRFVAITLDQTILSVPILAGPLLFLLLDRNFNTSFYDIKYGGNPLFCIGIIKWNLVIILYTWIRYISSGCWISFIYKYNY